MAKTQTPNVKKTRDLKPKQQTATWSFVQWTGANHQEVADAVASSLSYVPGSYLSLDGTKLLLVVKGPGNQPSLLEADSVGQWFGVSPAGEVMLVADEAGNPNGFEA